MYLYKVQCVHTGITEFMKSSLCVYVVARNPGEAQDIALIKMRVINYQYTDYVEQIELIASEEKHGAESILILSNQLNKE